MSFRIKPEQIQEIIAYAALADKEVRSDFSRGYVAGENDYTSLFTGALRRNLNTYSQAGVSVTSFVLKGHDERKSGCDAAIIIQDRNLCKIALFEAKWPMKKSHPRAWDYAQTSTGLSHFTDQIRRQSKLDDGFAVFEMFYSDDDFGQQKDFMEDSGSTCVWHEEALSHTLSKKNPDSVWKIQELEKLLESNRHSIAEILYEICSCHKGKPKPFFDPLGMITEYNLPGAVTVIDCSNEGMH